MVNFDMIGRLNQGFFGEKPQTQPAPSAESTAFCNGVVVSPFKHQEAELMMQYAKLHRKVAAGARFVITQVGFDARKFQEVLFYMRQHNLNIPLLGNVFIPNLPVVELMYQGKIPGCIIPEKLYQQIRQEAESPDRGKEARLIRAAKLLAVLEGLGFNGAHIGGPTLAFKDLELLIDRAREFKKDWRDWLGDLSFWPEEAFYYFQQDPASGLNLEKPNPPDRTAGYRSPMYSLAHLTHTLAFSPTGPLFKPCRKACLALEKTRLNSGLEKLEYLCKHLAFDCRNCGDCTLDKLAFLCPQSGCAKYLLNGPCGGSRNGWCEVYPGKKKCLYVKMYNRLKAHGREHEARQGFVPPRNWALANSSSWVNFYSGRDHSGRKDSGTT